MNKEVECILDEISEKIIPNEYWSKVRDYITKLQEDIRTGQEINGELQQENESLRTRIKTIKRLRKKQTRKKNKYKEIIFNEEKKLQDYKSRVEKALHYLEDRIEEWNNSGETKKNINQHHFYLLITNLLSILQNGGEDNER